MFKTGLSFSGKGGASSVNTSPITAPGGTVGGWHPTILYMAGLVVAEIIVVGFLSRHLLK